jgi:hypothetical protein
MIGATVSMMLDAGLNAVEKARFDRVQDRLAAMFAEKGHVIRLCQGTWHGNCRMIGFVAGLFGPPIVTIPASQFLSATDDELLYIADPTQGPLNTPVAVYAHDETTFGEMVAPNLMRQYHKGGFLGVYTHRHSYMAGINSVSKSTKDFPASHPQDWPHEKQWAATGT